MNRSRVNASLLYLCPPGHANAALDAFPQLRAVALHHHRVDVPVARPDENLPARGRPDLSAIDGSRKAVNRTTIFSHCPSPPM